MSSASANSEAQTYPLARLDEFDRFIHGWLEDSAAAMRLDDLAKIEEFPQERIGEQDVGRCVIPSGPRPTDELAEAHRQGSSGSCARYGMVRRRGRK